MTSMGWGSTQPGRLRCRAAAMCGWMAEDERYLLSKTNRMLMLTGTLRFTTQTLSGKQNFMSDEERTVETGDCND